MNTTSTDSLKSELDDLENVDDNAQDEDVSTSADLFTISSYGVDYNVDHLVKRIKNKVYYIPEFQRAYVWSQNDASKFIESLLLGLPVPGIFLYKESDTPRHLVIDGQQRLKSLAAFFNGLFKERKFKLSGLKTKWDGLAINELDDDDRIRLEDAVVHTTIFKQDSPSENMDSVYEVFERINTGGMKLSPQEIRSCVAQGSFNEFLFELNEHDIWRNMFGNKSIRLKDIELILRFFAFLEKRGNYKRPVKKFLTDYMTENKDLSENKIDEFRTLWIKTMTQIVEALGPRPFRPNRALNVALYDSFSVAIAERIRSNQSLDKKAIKQTYDALFDDEDYKKYISSGTSGEDSVQYRFKLAIALVNEFNDA
jgi:hypothetical protein